MRLRITWGRSGAKNDRTAFTRSHTPAYQPVPALASSGWWRRLPAWSSPVRDANQPDTVDTCWCCGVILHACRGAEITYNPIPDQNITIDDSAHFSTAFVNAQDGAQVYLASTWSFTGDGAHGHGYKAFDLITGGTLDMQVSPYVLSCMPLSRPLQFNCMYRGKLRVSIPWCASKDHVHTVDITLLAESAVPCVMINGRACHFTRCQETSRGISTMPFPHRGRGHHES